MRKFLLIGFLALTACAAQKSPEQIAEEQRILAEHEQKLAQIQVTKEDPKGCDFVGTAFNPLYADFRRISYDDAIKELREMALAKKSNTIVIDRIELTPSKLQTIVTGRLFYCP